MKAPFWADLKMSDGRACPWPNGQDEGNFGRAGRGVADGLPANGAVSHNLHHRVFFWWGLHELKIMLLL